MTMKQFVQYLIDNGYKPCGCYIAVMSTEDTWQLEVEVDNGVIGGCWDTNIPVRGHGPLKARAIAQVLQEELEKAGFKVYETREQWEQSWGDDYDECDD